MCGQSGTASGETHAFAWFDGVMIDLGTLGGTISTVGGVNDLGQIIGWSTTSGRDFTTAHAFLWDRDSQRDLGTLGGVSSFAFDINNRGDILGVAALESGEEHAVIWKLR